jgi:hypothetical protein
MSIIIALGNIKFSQEDFNSALTMAEKEWSEHKNEVCRDSYAVKAIMSLLNISSILIAYILIKKNLVQWNKENLK